MEPQKFSLNKELSFVLLILMQGNQTIILKTFAQPENLWT
jgi:hypothetical protein